MIGMPRTEQTSLRFRHASQMGRNSAPKIHPKSLEQAYSLPNQALTDAFGPSGLDHQSHDLHKSLVGRLMP